MALEVARPGETVLQHVAPGVAPVAVVAERRQRHAQVAGREDVELLAQAPARAAVVSDRHDGGDVVGQQPEGGQGSGEPVPTAERDDAALVWRAEGWT